eukprot:g14895.t1
MYGGGYPYSYETDQYGRIVRMNIPYTDRGCCCSCVPHPGTPETIRKHGIPARLIDLARINVVYRDQMTAAYGPQLQIPAEESKKLLLSQRERDAIAKNQGGHQISTRETAEAKGGSAGERENLLASPPTQVGAMVLGSSPEGTKISSIPWDESVDPARISRIWHYYFGKPEADDYAQKQMSEHLKDHDHDQQEWNSGRFLETGAGEGRRIRGKLYKDVQKPFFPYGCCHPCQVLHWLVSIFTLCLCFTQCGKEKEKVAKWDQALRNWQQDFSRDMSRYGFFVKTKSHATVYYREANRPEKVVHRWIVVALSPFESEMLARERHLSGVIDDACCGSPCCVSDRRLSMHPPGCIGWVCCYETEAAQE